MLPRDACRRDDREGMQGWVSAWRAEPSMSQLSSLTGAMQKATSTPSHLCAGTLSTLACLSPDLLTKRLRWEPLR